MVEDPGGDSIASNEPRGLPLLHLRVEEVSNLTAGVIEAKQCKFLPRISSCGERPSKTDLVKGHAADRMHGARAESWRGMLSSRSRTGGIFTNR